MEYMELKENNGDRREDLSKKKSQCNFYDEICEENGYDGDWSEHSFSY